MAKWSIVAAVILAIIITACTSDAATPTSTPSTAPSTTALTAGSSTTTSAAPDVDLPVVFADPDAALTPDELDRFSNGQFLFNEQWVQVGPTETANDGLGPLFNADSCVSCHLATGRRFVPPNGPLAEPGLVIRLATPGSDPTTNGPVPTENYGDQLQDQAIGANEPEATAFTNYVTQSGFYPDGTPFELIWPTVNVRDRNYGELPGTTLLSARIGAQMIGMGLLEAITDEDLLALADPTDSNGDGVSGRINMVWNPLTQQHEIGRFGWKSNVATLELQIAQAFSGDLGVTSTLLPDQNCSPTQTLCSTEPNGGTAEVSDERLGDIAFYLRTLAVPEPRTAGNPEAERGSEHFQEFGCATCHTPTLTTGQSPVAALSNREISPYTDLLLHDMGFDMADDRPDFDANGNEWRTPPLWGLGLIPVDDDRGLLHDGRARTIEEAILWHGGEGARSRNAFTQASAERRAELIAFLESL
jgi:CxxC motif-containing protein (DUF1111 family)